jgi:hypothetical protein
LSFAPPLSVYIDMPSSGGNYLKDPVIATGRVSAPDAAVTVNGFPADVASDGSFSAQVQLASGDNSLTAVATLGDKTDSMGFYFTMTELGALIPGPGQIHIFNAEYERLIYMEAGSTFTQNMLLDINKNIREPSDFSYQLSPVVYENGRSKTTSWPEGLELSIQPSVFQAYPNASYTSFMVIEASPDLPAGEYLFDIASCLEGGGMTTGGIKIVILPEGGAIEKTIEVNQSQTVNDITFTLERIELSATGIRVYAFNTPLDYALPQGPDLAPPQFMDLHAGGSYRIDSGAPVSAGFSGISFFDDGMWHTWIIDMPVAAGSKELEFTISALGDMHGPWVFAVALE